MKIALIGADGQLGTDIQKVIDKKDLIALTISDIDITNKDQTLEIIKKHSPDIIINTAAYHRVDDCEDNDGPAFAVNAIGVKNLCLASKEIDCELVHVSTDYVFDGSKGKPYVEADPPNPVSVYGISKLAGEYYIKYMMKKHYIVRGSGLFGVRGCMATGGRNFIELMLHLAKEKGTVRVVTDQIVSPTYTLDLAGKIKDLIKTKKYGTYHVTNNGQCSWYDFAKKIFELSGTKVKLEKTTSDEFKSKANRPAFSVLDNHNLRRIGLDDMRTWDKALEAYLKEKEK
ncbi:dTDP-4-dehydrorhamnose reductase [Candidatus Margulisiibacteriota bacterium]